MNKSNRCICGYLLNEQGECELCQTREQMGYRFCPRCQSEKRLVEFTDSIAAVCITCHTISLQRQDYEELPTESKYDPCDYLLNEQGECEPSQTHEQIGYRFCLGCGSDKPLDGQCVLCEMPRMSYSVPTHDPAEVAPEPVAAQPKTKPPKRMGKDVIAVQKQAKKAKIEALIARSRQQSAKKPVTRSGEKRAIVAISDYREYAQNKLTDELRDLITALENTQIKETGSPEVRAALDAMHTELTVALQFLTKGQGNDPATPTSL